MGIEELIARLEALLRRTGTASVASDGLLAVGDLTLDAISREVHRGGEEVRLTATEFELLRFLMLDQRRVLPKAEILDRVWKYDSAGTGTSSSSTSPTCAARWTEVGSR